MYHKWIAPEHVRQETRTEAGDIWSLGMVLAWLLNLLSSLDLNDFESTKWQQDVAMTVNQKYEDIVRKATNLQGPQTSFVVDLVKTVHENMLQLEPASRLTSGQLDIEIMLHLDNKIEESLKAAHTKSQKNAGLKVAEQNQVPQDPDGIDDTELKSEPPSKRLKYSIYEDNVDAIEEEEVLHHVKEAPNTPRKKARKGAFNPLYMDLSGKPRLPR